MDLIDLSGTVGLIAMGVLTLNILIGLLQSVHYDTAVRWPRRRINVFLLHNWTGYVGLAIALLHPVLLLFAPESRFRVLDVILPVRSPGEALENSLGAVALYGVAFVVVTSLLRRRLGRRLWKGFHYVAYAAAFSMFVHGIFTDAPNVPSAPLDPVDGERLVSEGCFLFVLVASGLRLRFALRHREEIAPPSRVTIVAAPTSAEDRGPTSHALIESAALPAAGWEGSLTVARVFVETPHVKTFRLVPEGGGPLPFSFLAGQFINVEIESDGRLMTRSYTISSSPAQRQHLEITLKREEGGAFSSHMHDRVTDGAVLRVRGPFGRFTFTGSEAARVVLVGGGIGVTPMMSVVRYLTDACWAGEIVFLQSHKAASDIVFASELLRLAEREPRLKLMTTLTEPGETWSGHRGRISRAFLAELLDSKGASRFHVCGPEPMMSAVVAMLEELGVSESAIAVESFGPSPKLPGSVSGALPLGDADAAPITISFQKSGKRAPFRADRTLLEIAHAEGVRLSDGCRIGVCGNCRVRLLSGEVDHVPATALSADDRRRGLILACQARVASSDIALDA